MICQPPQVLHALEQLELQLEELQADEGEVAKAIPETDWATRNKPCLSRCLSTCRATKRSTCPPPTYARLAVAACAS